MRGQVANSHCRKPSARSLACWLLTTGIASLLLVPVAHHQRPRAEEEERTELDAAREQLAVKQSDTEGQRRRIARQLKAQRAAQLKEIDSEVGRDLITDRAIRGTRMHVEGWFYERIRTLQVDGANEVGVETVGLSFSGH